MSCWSVLKCQRIPVVKTASCNTAGAMRVGAVDTHNLQTHHIAVHLDPPPHSSPPSSGTTRANAVNNHQPTSNHKNQPAVTPLSDYKHIAIAIPTEQKLSTARPRSICGSVPKPPGPEGLDRGAGHRFRSRGGSIWIPQTSPRTSTKAGPSSRVRKRFELFSRT